MSELICANANPKVVRKHLLVSASVFALTAYVSSASIVEASDRPTVWVELGGQMEQIQGASRDFMAPFMALPPEPNSYTDNIFSSGQRPARAAFGLQGNITFQPKASDWKFSVELRYSRARAKHHEHEQGPVHSAYIYALNHTRKAGLLNLHAAAFADVDGVYGESDTILDFAAGRDVGIGSFGRSGSSTISVGVRFAQFSSALDVGASARPSVVTGHIHAGIATFPRAQFNQYFSTGAAERSFRGIGPSLSWTASSDLLGNVDSGELTFDWGINGSLLFGKQKADVDHATSMYRYDDARRDGQYLSTLYPPRNIHNARSKSVTVPNAGGFLGFSVRYPAVKVSIGYRADFFFGATDTGVDASRSTNLGFNGPFATVSIGLGG